MNIAIPLSTSDEILTNELVFGEPSLHISTPVFQSTIYNFCFWNVRSINNKVRTCLQYLEDSNICIAFLSETWLAADSCSTTAIIKNESIYNIYNTSRIENRGGGVSIFISNTFVSKPYKLSEYKFFEITGAVITMDGQFRKIILISFYRKAKINQQYYPIGLFFDEFSEFLSILASNASPVLVGGDFNIKFNRSTDADTIKFVNIIEEFGFHLSYTETKTHTSGNTLDACFYSCCLADYLADMNSDVNEIVSDHYPVSIQFKNQQIKPSSQNSNKRTYRNLQNLDSDIFICDLTNSLNTDFIGTDIESLT